MITWRVGELAEATGLTVRTLHYYDEIGILVPSERTESGRRVYHPADAERLYHICALKALGMPLSEIADVLDARSIAEVLSRHLEQLNSELRRITQLRNRVRRLVNYADDQLDSRQLIGLVAAMTEMERYFTPAQLDTLARRRGKEGFRGASATERKWRQLADELRPLCLGGAPISSPDVQRIAGEADRLIDHFTGGDTRMRRTLDRLRTHLPPEGLAGWDAELLDFLYEALAHRNDGLPHSSVSSMRRSS